MSTFPKSLKELCTPSLIYFLISIVSLIMILLQNLEDNTSYNLGTFSCKVPNTFIIFIIKLIYILFWTWILNLICKDGHTSISWLLILLPWLLLFVIIGIIMLNM
jgi:hypothetical protein